MFCEPEEGRLFFSCFFFSSVVSFLFVFCCALDVFFSTEAPRRLISQTGSAICRVRLVDPDAGSKDSQCVSYPQLRDVTRRGEFVPP